MASASEPKKRGRPRKSTGSVAEPPAAVEDPKPQKRGKAPKKRDTGAEDHDGQAEERPQKRAKPSTAQEVAEGQGDQPKSSNTLDKASGKATSTAAAAGVDTADPDPTVRRSGRDRRSADLAPWWTAAPSDVSPPAKVSDETTRLTKQTKNIHKKSSMGKSDNANAVKKTAAETAGTKTQAGPGPRSLKSSKMAEEANAAGAKARRKARDRRPADSNIRRSLQDGESVTENAQAESAASAPHKSKSKRGRPSLGEVAVSQAQNQSDSRETAHKGSKASRRGSGGSKDDNPSSNRRQKTKGHGAKSAARTSGAASDTEVIRQQRRGTSTIAEPRRRRRSDQADEPAEAATGPTPKYRHLTSRTRQIPRTTISAKWSSLDEAAVAAVDSIVSDASRPVLFRLRDRDQRHQQAQTILRTFASRLHSKLLKGMPFPPPSLKASTGSAAGRGSNHGSSHESELDFERTVDAIEALEKALDPLLHSVALLTAEKEREEAELEREYKMLRTLETNARAEAREWRERGKRDHALAPGIRAIDAGTEAEGIETVKSEKRKATGGVFKVSFHVLLQVLLVMWQVLTDDVPDRISRRKSL